MALDRYDLARRLLTLVDEARAGKNLSISYVMKKFGVQKAAARRYIQVVNEHVDLGSRIRGGRKIFFKKGEAEQAFNLTLALELARALSPWFERTSLAKQLEAIVKETRQDLPTGDVDALDRMIQSFHFKWRPRPRTQSDARNLDSLLEAIRHCKQCIIEYTRLDGTEKEYTINPWSLNVVDEVLFLLAGKIPGDEPRSFAVSEIRTVKVLDRPFVRPAAFESDPSRMLRDSVGTYAHTYGEVQHVFLRVRGSARARLRRRPLHRSQTMDPPDDVGWSNVRLRVLVCPELVASVLALLPDVRVVEPDALRRKVREAAAAALGSEADP